MSESQRRASSGSHLRSPKIAAKDAGFDRHAKDAKDASRVRITDCYPFNDVDVTDPASIVRELIDAGGYAFTEREDGQVIALVQARRFYVPSAPFRIQLRHHAIQLTREDVREAVLNACEVVVVARVRVRGDIAAEARGLAPVLSKVRALEAEAGR